MMKFLKRAFIPYPYKFYMVMRKTIFIHIPRTGGTSFLSVFSDNIFREHYTYKVFMYSDPQKFAKYFKFAFVRNPYDRLFSVYKYLLQGGNKKSDVVFQKLIREENLSFEQFVMDFVDAERIHEIALLRPQYLYIFNQNKECMVDFIGSFEDIISDSKYVMDKLKISKRLPHKNKSNKDDLLMTNDMQEKIITLYHNDFKLLGYENLCN